MSATDGCSDLLAALGESVCGAPDVEFAVAFGSWSTGRSRPDFRPGGSITLAEEEASYA